MRNTFIPFAAVLLGVGCSHATPKPETRPMAVVGPPRSAARSMPKQVVSEFMPSPVAHDAAAGNAIFFDFDSALLRDDSRATLQQVGQELLHAQRSIRIEGNCDERGTTEYNLVLGDRRAVEARKYLERLGLPSRRISIVSYGSERPKAQGHDEAAWAANRRDDIVIR
jgi:peptidoglycan-associated lipoprotein